MGRSMATQLPHRKRSSNFFLMTLGKSGYVLAILLMAVKINAHAFDFSAVGDEPAVLYDAPSHNGARLFIAPPHMPVELLLTYQDWTKVRDASGDMAWLESKVLGQKHFVVINVKQARIYTLPDVSSPVVFHAKKNVILEKLKTAESGWIKVSHPDGLAGFVRINDVWGM